MKLDVGKECEFGHCVIIVRGPCVFPTPKAGSCASKLIDEWLFLFSAF